MTRKGAVLAIDHGAKRTGFAVVDALRIAPQPLEVWHGDGGGEELVERVLALLAERDVEAIVVGVPLAADGSETGRSAEVRGFIERLRARVSGVPVVSHDERLSTQDAELELRAAGLHGKDRKTRKDSFSALVILRDWLAAGEPR
jgi:putative Holliday junction resolvase